MGMWDGIESVEVFVKGQYLEPGIYVIDVERCKANDGANGEAFIVEMKIAESNNAKHPAGSTASWVRTFKDKVNVRMSQAAIVEFVLAAMGRDPQDKEQQEAIRPHLKQILEKATGEENALQGRRVRLETFHTPTKSGGVFTIHRWRPYLQEAA